MPKNKLRLNIREVLGFFDEVPGASRGHATAIVSVIGEDLGTSLLQKCLSERDGATTKVIMKNNGVPLTPTLGTGSGDRLDRWLLEDVPQNGKRRLYQVEIKNWSAHAIGGKVLPLAAESKVLEDYRRNRWLKHWDVEKGCFRDPKAGKVLTRMKIPEGIEGALEVEPIICFWDSIHPEGRGEPLFEYHLSSVSRDGFRSFRVFSISNYLRSVGELEIELDMPTAAPRIEWFHKLFNLGCASESST
jgi:hypothetical protein